MFTQEINEQVDLLVGTIERPSIRETDVMPMTNYTQSGATCTYYCATHGRPRC